ncbi:MAG: hypothetical protein A2X93_04570 [Deltaproteobacteria bacterium GWC2_56_8]|nr:MAG: hypothetical protein A2X99_07940 [Deltaproteobacteria bacterium GWB2_55_19]OGP32570.1 MAG: hypothetical protein A2X93_04570 [Deltaproteobacteria bacterium GWC2_56_8]HAO93159.1 nitrite reductase large subunit [Deltaproteobacteria bacterium]
MRERNGKERIVVIGNGMAGTACVEEILKLAPARFDVTVFGAERHSYNRVLLAQVLTGEKTLEDISLHNREWYAGKGINLHAGARITEIKRWSRVVVTESGLEAPYDRLIFATGSLPVMPPIPGIDKEGVLPFRNIGDCERIASFCRAGGRAVVIGGGLLGLEAAWSLKKLGMETTLVHIMDRLMERQLDLRAASFLKDDIDKTGIKVLLNKKTEGLLGNGRVEGLKLSDGSTIPADLVVVSTGIRPNAELARSAGIYCNRGIVVSDCMQTYDPAVFAVGECVEHRGATFGLVGPIFDQARVLANHLAGDARLVFKSQTTSVRLKVPGIELYSAGEVEETEGVEAIEYLDKGARTYKKLLVSEGRLKGIVMYGDTHDGPRLFSSLLEGEDISHKRKTIFAAESARGSADSIEAMPDNAIVCGCRGVTKKAIVDAITTKGLFTREDIKRETGASSSCGGCAPLVERILEATLGSDFNPSSKQGLCACTRYTRDDVVKNIRELGLRNVAEVLSTLGWEGVGCEECRPAINYYGYMANPSGWEDDPGSRLVNERAKANIQNDGTFSVVPRIYGGVVTPGELKKIADAAVKFDVPLVKITGGQRIALVGVKRTDLKPIWEDLGMRSGAAYAKAVRTVKTCVGSTHCRYGTQDSMSFGMELEKRYEGVWTPAKVKMGVSGCPRNCAEAGIKDIGIVGLSGAWEIYAGGSGGIEVARARKLSSVKTSDEAVAIADALLQLYREEAEYGERLFKWMEREGVESIKKTLANDEKSGGLRKRLEISLASLSDPWKEKALERPPAA